MSIFEFIFPTFFQSTIRPMMNMAHPRSIFPAPLCWPYFVDGQKKVVGNMRQMRPAKVGMRKGRLGMSTWRNSRLAPSLPNPDSRRWLHPPPLLVQQFGFCRIRTLFALPEGRRAHRHAFGVVALQFRRTNESSRFHGKVAD